MTAAPSLGADDLERLCVVAEQAGVLRLAAVSVDHPAFARAAEVLDDYLDAGMEGEMGFMARTREVRKAPDRLLEGARSVLVGLVPYRGEPGPVARYAQWADYHTQMHRRLESVVAALEAMVPGVESMICVDSKPLAERTAAMAAGLGFLGKNGCLIARGLGSYVLIGAVVTTAELAPTTTAPAPASDSSAMPWDACGSCTACLDACPTAAFDAPGRLDPRRCIAYLTIEHRGPIDESLAAGMGERVGGCDVCQEVCPHNASEHIAARVPEVAWLPPPPGRPRDPDPLCLAVVGNNQHKGFVKHTPLSRIPRPALRRNALIAVGNRPGPATQEERAVLEQVRDQDDAGLAAWAAWALARRGG